MDFLNYVHIIKMCFFSFDLQKSCKYINRANRACLEVGICFARIFAIFHFFYLSSQTLGGLTHFDPL